MKPKVVTIMIDSLEHDRVDRWIKEGELPVLAGFRAEAARAPVKGVYPFLAELPQLAFATSTKPQTLRCWGAFDYDAATMQPIYARAYDYNRIRAFYDYHSDLKVCLFDLPKSGLLKVAKGVQVLNWGAHGSLNDDQSFPPAMRDEIVAQYGTHPAVGIEHAEPWQVDKLHRLVTALHEGVETRTQIQLDLLDLQAWDLVHYAYSEVHSLGHALMHLEDAQFADLDQTGLGPQALRLMQTVDRSIGRLLAALGPQDTVVIYATHGMDTVNWDNTTMFLLPDYLYRLQFADQRKLPADALPPMTFGHGWWGNAAWQASFGSTRTKPDKSTEMAWIPGVWYKEDWPKMRAFALPGLDEGMIRLNVVGREPQGLVDPREYEAELDKLERLLSNVTDPRTGRAAVKGFYRTRSHALQDETDLPPADLIVQWSDETIDALLCPVVGQIGPVPLRRTGGHTTNGFAWFKGPDFAPGDRSAMSNFDFGPTILDVLRRDMPNHFDGQSLMRGAREAPDQALFPFRAAAPAGSVA